MSAYTYVAACGRHLAKWFNGEEIDQKTRVPHLANALACIAVIIDAHVHGSLIDDRPPKTDVAKLLDEFEGIVKHLHEMFPNGAKRYTDKNTVPERLNPALAGGIARPTDAPKEVIDVCDCLQCLKRRADVRKVLNR